MVEVNPPEFLGAECYTFEDFRQAFNGVVCVEGVTDVGDLLVTAAGGASIDVNVAAGTAWVEGNLNGAKGMYYVENDASVAMTIAANGAGSSRIDLILATVYDSQYIGASDAWALEVVQGVAGAGVPAVPASTRSGYLVLGHVTVPASGGTPSVVSSLADTIRTCGTPDAGQPYVTLLATGATSIPDTAANDTKVDLATTVHIDSGFYTVAASVVTITQDGLYDLNVRSGFSNMTGKNQFSINLNGLGFATEIGQFDPGPQSTGPETMDGTITLLSYPLSAGNTIQLGAYQESGGAVSTSADSRLTVRKVG